MAQHNTIAKKHKKSEPAPTPGQNPPATKPADISDESAAVWVDVQLMALPANFPIAMAPIGPPPVRWSWMWTPAWRLCCGGF
jgi:hypothetical protein